MQALHEFATNFIDWHTQPHLLIGSWLSQCQQILTWASEIVRRFGDWIIEKVSNITNIDSFTDGGVALGGHGPKY